MEIIFITNKIKYIENIVINYINEYKNFNIKNLNIETLKKIKIKINKNQFYLENICNIKNINEKTFLLEFNKIEFLKETIRNNALTNYGFKITKIKNLIELKIPNLSVEFRHNILNILKNEYSINKEKIENYRKKFLLEIKNYYKSKEDYILAEKIFLKELILIKKKFQSVFNNFSNKILNE
ncbi:ribosome recycling factor [Candidatus Carsonella ruddii]|uniref:Ribosome recycling factor domain-containing protein n=1 Tax=Candidatus Carsonella ruddii (Diaphorina cf. continua) TaxID=2661587 RepID=A0A7R6VZB5_CARRU|nr:ribosome recycling factor [Candidatus Carsonella ruddii (Diaphorina cf. continua)]BCG49239.1 hypothetical protein CRDco_0210 [Candidatus Carsonella ruddii (Diaphorina cf. continua)]